MSRDYEGALPPLQLLSSTRPDRASIRPGSETVKVEGDRNPNRPKADWLMPAFPLPLRTSRYRKSLSEAGCEKIFTEHVRPRNRSMRHSRGRGRRFDSPQLHQATI